jgi:flavin-binding protein dodecin
MAESVYKMVELVGTSTQSWEKAAAAAVSLAAKSLRDLRVAEVTQLDLHIVDGKVVAYRAKLNLSFKYETGEEEAKAPPAAKPAAKGRGRAKALAAAPPEEPMDDEMPAPKKGARKAKRKPAKA